MHNKKAQLSEEVMLYIPRIIFLIAVLFAVVILVKVFVVTNIDIKQVEANVLINRILYSRGGLSYYDEELKRVYPGVIDLDRFRGLAATPNMLDSLVISYGFDNPIIAAKITLKGVPEQKQDYNLDVFYNKESFEKWEPRVLPTVSGGAGSVEAFKEQKYVMVKDGQNLVPGVLEFYIIG